VRNIAEVLREETLERSLVCVACLGDFARGFEKDVLWRCEEFLDRVGEEVVEQVFPVWVGVGLVSGMGGEVRSCIGRQHRRGIGRCCTSIG
jgi:hypothetical protein